MLIVKKIQADFLVRSEAFDSSRCQFVARSEDVVGKSEDGGARSEDGGS